MRSIRRRFARRRIGRQWIGLLVRSGKPKAIAGQYSVDAVGGVTTSMVRNNCRVTRWHDCRSHSVGAAQPDGAQCVRAPVADTTCVCRGLLWNATLAGRAGGRGCSLLAAAMSVIDKRGRATKGRPLSELKNPRTGKPPAEHGIAKVNAGRH